MQIFSTYIIELAVISALVSLFLDFCFREGNIFEGWLEFWSNAWLKIHKPKLLPKISKASNDTVLKSGHSSKRDWRIDETKWFWFKPLGGCVVCMNVWISFAMCLAFFREWEFIVVVLLSSLIVRFFQEKIV